MKINKGDTRYVYIAPDMWFAEWKIIRPVSNSTLGYRGVLFEIVQRKKRQAQILYCRAFSSF